MRGTVFIFLGVVIGINISSSNAFRVCYNCVGAASAADCNKITRCGSNEECFEEEVVTSHNVLFNSGCRSKRVCETSTDINIGKRANVVVCSKCCDSDFCNVGLCVEAAPRGLRCLSCPQVTMRASDCDRIEQCSEDAMCYAHKILDPADLEPRYETGCLGKIQCEAFKHVSVINMCTECCDTPMCNLHKCGYNWTAVYRTSSQPSVTEATTLTSIVYKAEISGTTSLDYHGNGSLNCTSNAQNVNYTWIFNEGTFLPEHDNILHIHNMTESKMGMYTCVVSKEEAIAAARIQVTIKEAPADVVSVWSSPQGAMQDREINLHCEVTGYPVPVINWSFSNPEGQPYVPANVTYPSYEIVHIQNFSPRYHRGTWTCIATNKFGNDTLGMVVG